MYTLSEILSQCDSWRVGLEKVQAVQALLVRELVGNHQGRQIYFTGCGSSYYLAVSAASHLRRLTRMPTQAVPASELWFDPASYFHPDDVLVAISRSGATTETLGAVDAFHNFRKNGGIVIQCVPHGTLAQKETISLVIPSGAEKSFTQTRSFTTMFVAAVAMNVAVSVELNMPQPPGVDLSDALKRLPEAGNCIIEMSERLVPKWVEHTNFDRTYILGSGTRYGLACEASLKMIEMALIPCQPFHFLEFGHGPQAMVDNRTLVIGLVSGSARNQELLVLHEAKSLGAQIMAIGEQMERIDGGEVISFESHLPEAVRDVLYLPPLQMMAVHCAITKGLDPDHPRHLQAVRKLGQENEL